uniref:Uncharacterized protein n=1 Tax=Attheya septentrionalis TaxID=420275 RepID=A0A7S2UAN1_9STRA|eukprot:CAMPEP_0198282738 /NCGR_PEP_ID=MMETSP1449-20131203/2508_1 /TAXON_ID=420275 /ORGANISM="Attheya septentrionalis, Strain CCMP2084" /LENGTH=163 /DNA_ID=CAMNT_0043979121 /DNA_START=32 /DNA_END=523 /DNA_ORIENTATION=+
MKACVLYAATLPLLTTAWIPNHLVYGPRCSTLLTWSRTLGVNEAHGNVNNDDSEWSFIQAYRANLESSYTSSEQIDELMEESNSLINEERTQLHESFMTTPASAYSSDWFDGEGLPCGDECEQCEIPDDFKDSTGFEPVDVMAFLGIRRAEPLRVERNQPDWE